MNSHFLLVVLYITLVFLVCSAQKMVHSLCFSENHSPMFIKYYCSIYLGTNPHISSSIRTFKIQPRYIAPKSSTSSSFPSIYFHCFLQNSYFRRAKILADLEHSNRPKSNHFRSGEINVRPLIQLTGCQHHVPSPKLVFQKTRSSSSQIGNCNYYRRTAHRTNALKNSTFPDSRQSSFLLSRQISSLILTTEFHLETLNYLRLSRRSRFRLDENNVSSLAKFSGFQYTNIPFSTFLPLRRSTTEDQLPIYRSRRSTTETQQLSKIFNQQPSMIYIRRHFIIWLSSYRPSKKLILITTSSLTPITISFTFSSSHLEFITTTLLTNFPSSQRHILSTMTKHQAESPISISRLHLYCNAPSLAHSNSSSKRSYDTLLNSDVLRLSLACLEHSQLRTIQMEDF